MDEDGNIVRNKARLVVTSLTDITNF